MNSEKEALEYLVGLGETKVLEIKGKEFTTNPVYSVKDPKPAALTVTTLTALVNYIKSKFDKKSSEQLLIHVESPDKVILYSELRDDKERETYMCCNALLTDNISFGRFMNTENFNIMLQSSFVENEDRTLLLQVTGNIQDKAVKQIGDDGVSQSATIKTGVATVNDVKIPNPVSLAPYRTFPEIDQPKSKFIFRMQSGPSAALFEADGGAWRNAAMNSISEFLQTQLLGENNIKIIS